MIYINLVVGLVAGLILFLCSIKAYTLGIAHGKQLSQATVPKVNLNPVKAIQEAKTAKEEKKQADLIAEGWNNILSYTGEPQER